MQGEEMVKIDDFKCNEIYSETINMFALHQHQMIEISLITEGTGVHRVWNEVFPCRKGGLCVLNIAVPHGYYLKEPDSLLSVSRILFDVNDILQGEFAEIGNENFMFGLFSSNNFANQIKLNLKQIEQIQGLFKDISSEIKEKHTDWKSAVRAKIILLVITIKRIYSESQGILPMKISEDRKVVATAMRMINQRYMDPEFSLDDIAEALYMSKASASRIFHSVTSEYFSDYLRNIRIKRGAYLMKNTDLSIDDVVVRCGYRDVPNFYRQFKRMFGMPPQKYREQILIENGRDERRREILSLISESVQSGNSGNTEKYVLMALEENISPENIMDKGLVDGMSIIGSKFTDNQVFVPEVLVAARALNKGLDILRPILYKAGIQPIGRAVVCTVKGDMHDIGKNIVKLMLEGQGIECLDLGVDVEAEKVVEAVIKTKGDIVCLSSLLTTTMIGLKDVIDALQKAGLRQQVYVMVGGAPVSQEFADAIGADCYTMDAASAAKEAKRFLTEKRNKNEV